MKEKSISSEVRHVLNDAMFHGRHADGCAYWMGKKAAEYLPARHPARANIPVCDCWKSRAAELINLPNS